MFWISLILSLPSDSTTIRMRTWRALKAAGAVVLRDGVYLLPARADCVAILNSLAAEVRAHGGTAWCVELAGVESEEFQQLFDRSSSYAELATAIAACLGKRRQVPVAEAARQARKLRKTLQQISSTDFFPGTAGQHAEAALQELESAVAQQLSPDEPQPQVVPVFRRMQADFSRRLWATRRRPRVDRLASAWLILRYIDREASFLWLAAPGDCPADAVGFDFDGAEFTHVAARVTFETLLTSFGLEQAALQRIAALVHALDVGGARPPEADGLEKVLEGFRSRIPDDDALLNATLGVFDSLLTAFEEESGDE